MNKSGIHTYLIQYKDSFIVESADNEGGHGLPLDIQGISDQF